MGPMPPFGKDDSILSVGPRLPHVGIARRKRVRPSAHTRRKAEPLREVAMSLDVLIKVVILFAPFRRGQRPGLDNGDRQVR